MRGDGFVLPKSERLPSVFSALALLFSALAGRYPAALLGEGTAYLAALIGIKLGTIGLNALVSFYYYAFFMLLPMGLYLYLHKGAGEYIRFKPLSGKNALICVLCGGTGVIFVSVVGVFWSELLLALGLTPAQSSLNAGSTSQLAELILMSAVVPALCEELLCRGMVLSAYEGRGSVRAILISAVWFSCLHASVEGLPAELLSGLILGCVTVFTGSVFAGIIHHTVHNSVILILSYALSSAASDASGAAARDGSVYTGLIVLGLLSGWALYLLLRRMYRDGGDKLLPKQHAPGRDIWEALVLVCVLALTAVYYLLDILDMAVPAV
ncbi:MAG: CPBP family intramembrane metalloprotease [Clostridiales bacterium]|nr:CPBP family intramembrane metalloprotease [Clostridiales bacterium]